MQILVLYHSQEHGNTKKMAEALAEGARQAGAEVELVNTNEVRANVEVFRAADAVAIGSPDYYSYIAGNLKQFWDDWYIAQLQNPTGLKNKPLALFCSHGGGGKVRGVLEKLATQLGTPISPTIACYHAPDDASLQSLKELGEKLAKSV